MHVSFEQSTKLHGRNHEFDSKCIEASMTGSQHQDANQAVHSHALSALCSMSLLGPNIGAKWFVLSYIGYCDNMQLPGVTRN